MASGLSTDRSVNNFTVAFEAHSYGEHGNDQPFERWLTLTTASPYAKWHVKVAFRGTFPSVCLTREQRRDDLKQFCLCIDFKLLKLYSDTITNMFIQRATDAPRVSPIPLMKPLEAYNDYAHILDSLSFRLEPEIKKAYPILQPSHTTPSIDQFNIKIVRLIKPSVCVVQIRGNSKLYVYKMVPMHFAPSDDIADLKSELRNLQLLRGFAGIVRLVATVSSENPYHTLQSTRATECTTVLRGILLEYHPNGTLYDALQSPQRYVAALWLIWGLQIARAVAHIHTRGLTHMDLKPENVVISAEWDAVVIDVGANSIT
ncbi:kinase-like domain-containing protein [Xylaria arbuscula]|nr:kinase-like domain-containing protein [Xylaria arbuscula]